MVINLPLKEILNLPHANCEDMQGRIFPLHPLLDENGKWHLWIPQNDKISDVEGTLVESNYFAKTPNKSSDIIFPFLEFIEKRALWPDIQPFIKAITSDIHNLASSMAKIDVLFQAKRSSELDIRRMIGTELEYIFITCRSLFDLLQKIISNLWDKIKITSPELSKKQLPKRRFAEVCLNGKTILSVESIATKYQIPNELATFYNRNAKFFQWLRDYRDSIAHKDGEFDLIFIDEKGPVILKSNAPFDSMPIWRDTNTLPNNLGSVKSVVSHIILSTLSAFDDTIEFFKTRIIFPADVVPNYRMYTRGVHNNHLINLKNNILNPW